MIAGIILTVVSSFLIAHCLPSDLPEKEYYFYACVSNIPLVALAVLFCDMSHKLKTNLPLIILGIAAIIDASFMYMYFECAKNDLNHLESNLNQIYWFNSLNWNLIYTSIELAVLIRIFTDGVFVRFCLDWIDRHKRGIFSANNILFKRK